MTCKYYRKCLEDSVVPEDITESDICTIFNGGERCETFLKIEMLKRR